MNTVLLQDADQAAELQDGVVDVPLEGGKLEEHGLTEEEEAVGIEVQAGDLPRVGGDNLRKQGVPDDCGHAHGGCVLGRHRLCVPDHVVQFQVQGAIKSRHGNNRQGLGTGGRWPGRAPRLLPCPAAA